MTAAINQLKNFFTVYRIVTKSLQIQNIVLKKME